MSRFEAETAENWQSTGQVTLCDRDFRITEDRLLAHLQPDILKAGALALAAHCVSVPATPHSVSHADGHKMSQDATRCHKMTQNATRCHKMSQDVTGSHRHKKSQHFSRRHKMSQDATRCHKMSKDITGNHKMSADFTRCHKISHDVRRCHKHLKYVCPNP